MKERVEDAHGEQAVGACGRKERDASIFAAVSIDQLRRKKEAALLSVLDVWQVFFVGARHATFSLASLPMGVSLLAKDM